MRPNYRLRINLRFHSEVKMIINGYFSLLRNVPPVIPFASSRKGLVSNPAGHSEETGWPKCIAILLKMSGSYFLFHR